MKEDSKRNWKTRNLWFAKHRHSSTLKPASRCILHLSAVIHAAMELLVNDESLARHYQSMTVNVINVFVSQRQSMSMLVNVHVSQ